MVARTAREEGRGCLRFDWARWAGVSYIVLVLGVTMLILLLAVELWSIPVVDTGVDDGRLQAGWGADDRFQDGRFQVAWDGDDRAQAAGSWSPLGRYGEVASAYWTLHVSHAAEASTLQKLIDTWRPGTFQVYSARETQMVQSAMVGAAMALSSGFVGPWMGARGTAAVVTAGGRRR